ncbi:hypothetical protein TARUN_3238 [Trichoderma arundinaceum]|uniref:Uncharacterized protein n=1 Tax=Trichoderma arundinaceum TaxID=490622 RepID=A0A395NSP2_TRIAR|nr:hypothetical protein TARUN_3238 [Trichoderma arundinaceum]
MGAEQSSYSESRRTDTESSHRTCYYDLLDVERTATDIEIKKAYRKKALELHPDRNINDVEAATRKFAEVQAAYDILSDPQERAWYDSHREGILSGQHEPSDASMPPTFRNIHLTTADDIMRLISRFNSTVPYTDETNGFYLITRETFQHLAEEEEAAADYEDIQCPEYPTFGSSSSGFEDIVKPFYNAWTGFTTRKSFMWEDKYRLSEAPDRRTRRWMEKENKKIRDDAAREFTDAVRFLVSFVRKRDPRYLPNTQSEADRHKSLRTAAAAQAARSRAANKENYSSFEVPEWVHSRDNETDQQQLSESEESETEILECVACNKKFKSEKQFESHERSKKHVKAIQDLRRQMKKETANLELDPTPVNITERSLSEDREQRAEGVDTRQQKKGASVMNASSLPRGERSQALNQAKMDNDPQDATAGNETSPGQGASEPDDDANHSEQELSQPFDKLNLRSTNEEPSYIDHGEEIHVHSPKQSQTFPIDETTAKTKTGKAKLKRQKKAAAMAVENEVFFSYGSANLEAY